MLLSSLYTVLLFLLQIDAALSSAHETWKRNEEKKFHNHLQSVLRQASKDQDKKVADAVKKNDSEWAVKYRTLRDETERSRQRSATDIMELNAQLSKGESCNDSLTLY